MRAVAVALLGLLLAAGPASAASLDLERVTVAELQAEMAAGELTSVELAKAYLDRIAALNSRGPGLNAVRLVNPDALTDAALLDHERSKTGARGPLHGIPVLVKDNLDVAGLPTTAGAIALEDSIATSDSTVVARLRSAGAVILGKTNLSEFANFITNSNPSGYSGLGGQVLHALDADQNPSGSSSGSATAAAAALAAITIGTETSGSIVSPSLWRCVPGSEFTAHSCAPGEPANETPVATDVSGTVPATLSLTLSSAVIDLGVFRPGVARDDTAAVGATVISTAGSATLSAQGERLANGQFSLARPLDASAGGPFAPLGGTLVTYPGPVSNDALTISLRQSIGASEGLRTGRYGTTVVFTLSTDSP